MEYHISSKTATGTKKLYYEPNGDWYRSLDNGNCVVLAVADGVGTCASDSRASHTACDSFIEKCASAFNRNEVLDESVIQRFCVEIDPVLAGHNDLSCFSAAIWYTNTNQVIWLNVGDTRIYKCSRSGIMTQMTIDDRAVANKKSNNPKYGKYQTEHGALVPSVGVKYALGDCRLKFHTGSFEFLSGESLILCSDGMYNSLTFDNDMAKLLGSFDLDEAIKRIETTDQDDNTLLVLRRDMTVDTHLDELMTQFEQDSNAMPSYILIDGFCNGLKKLLEEDTAAHDIAKAAAFMKQHQLYPDRQHIESLYQAAYDKLKSSPQGEDWQQLNAACRDLLEMLRYVFKHSSK